MRACKGSNLRQDYIQNSLQRSVEIASKEGGKVRNLKDAPVYPMRTVVRLTGVGPHKLRFWEGRYGLITPTRTNAGHRLYSKRDLEQIKTIAELVEKQGFSLVAVKEMLTAESLLVGAGRGGNGRG